MELNFFLFFIEYFIGIIVFYIMIVYLLIVNNIFGILIYKSVCDCLSFIFLLISYLIYNDLLFFLIDFNQTIFIILNNNMLFDYLAIFSKLVIIFLSIIFFTIISNLLIDYKLTSIEFILLILINIFGLIFLCSSFDLLLIFIAIELVSLSSYFLTAFNKTSIYSINSGINYLIMGVISSAFFLIGTLFFYYYTGSILLSDVYILTLNIETLFFNTFTNFINILIYKYNFNESTINFFCFKNWLFEYILINNFIIKCHKPLFDLGILLICFSIFIKLGLAPFHFWSLEVYENSLSIITFFFITLTKLSYFIILFRIYNFFIYKSIFIFNFILILIGFLSIFIGSFANLRQKKLKILLTYSSISHMGYIILSFSSNSLLGLEIGYFYLLIYFFSNIIIWFIILMLKKKVKNYNIKYSKTISDFILLYKSNKIFSFGLLLVLFSIAGVPPIIGFFAKLGVFLSLISEQILIFSLITLFCSIISTFYYIRLIKIIYFENYIVGKLYFPTNLQIIVIYCFINFLLIFLFLHPKLVYLISHKILLFNNYCSF